VIEQVLLWMGAIAGLLTALAGGGVFLSRARRHKDENDSIQSYLDGKITLMEWAQKLESKVAEQGQQIAEQDAHSNEQDGRIDQLERALAEALADNESLKWSINQEDEPVPTRIFVRAAAKRKQEG
jgi:uncharacterized coiled-coil protein SlyX